MIWKVCKFKRLMIFFEISTCAGLFSQFYGFLPIFSLQNDRWTSDAFNRLKKPCPKHAFFLATTSRICIPPYRILIFTAHRMCISTMLQCMHLWIYIVHVHGVDQKYFWTLNKITHCSALYWFNIHYTRIHFSKNWLKQFFSVLIPTVTYSE